MPTKPQELHSDKKLLDSNFEGYKLSLNEIPCYSHELPSNVRKLSQVGDQFSYLYLSLFSMQNHLINDSWNENALYYITENSTISRIILRNIDAHVSDVQDVLTLPLNSNSDQERYYNPTLVFVDPYTAIVSDGLGSLHILNTGDRCSTEKWIIEHTASPMEKKSPFIVLDARCIEKDDTRILHCLLITIVDDKDKTLVVSRASTDLQWIFFKKTRNGPWNLEGNLKMNSKGSVKYAYFSPQCESLFIESTKPVNLPDCKSDESTTDKSEKKVAQYYWQQSTDDIKIWFSLPRGCVKDDIQIKVTDNSLSIDVRAKTFLKGGMFHRLHADLTSWSITDNRAEIILSKQEEGLMWSYLVKGDDRGEEVFDSELVKEIHERLSHLCCENEALADDTAPTFNPGQLEACDNAPEEDSRLVAIDAVTKSITHEVVLGGHQKLFNVCVSPIEPPYLCVRHDVDGTLWEVDSKREELCRHVGTLNAFGYVLASKQWKYSTCSPDFSYAVIAPTKQNLLVYKQNCSVNSQLKNRKTGHSYTKVGKQFLITLNTNEEILGVHASNSSLFVLTKSKFFVYRMRDVE